jgi:hypothetical protein
MMVCFRILSLNQNPETILLNMNILKLRNISGGSFKRRFSFSLLLSFIICEVHCQGKDITNYFLLNNGEIIITTLQEQNDYYEMLDKFTLPDNIALKYFFNSDVNEQNV